MRHFKEQSAVGEGGYPHGPTPLPTYDTPSYPQQFEPGVSPYAEADLPVDTSPITDEEIFAGVQKEVNTGNQGPPENFKFRLVDVKILPPHDDLPNQA